MKFKLILFFLCFSIFVYGCSSFTLSNGFTLNDSVVNNLTYYFNQFPFPSKVTLSDGIAYPPAGDYTGSAYIKNVGPTIFEDVDFDNDKDAITILEGWFGGTGTFKFIAVVLNKNGKAINIGTAFLGESININSILFENNIISVEFTFTKINDIVNNNSKKYFTFIDGVFVEITE